MQIPRLNIRADEATIARLDRIASRLSHPGAELTRSDAARAAMQRGLAEMEAELGIAEKGGKPARKPARAK